MDAIRAKVAKFRTEVKKILPYFLGEVYGMLAIEEKRVGTMAVDEQGRMYYSPSFVERCSIPQGRYTVCHETLHVALGHAKLARKILGDNPTPDMLRRWNWAADCVVNQILEPWQHEAPGEDVLGPGAQIITYQLLGLPAKRTVVEYYDLLTEQDDAKQEAKRPKPQADNDPSRSGEDEDDDSSTEGDDDESEGEDGSDRGEDEREDDGDRGGDESEGPAADGAGDEAGGEDGEQGGDEADGDGDDSDGEEGNEEARGDGVRSPGDGGEDSEEGDGDAGDESASDTDWSPAGGSGADGQPRDYEAEPDPSWADREYSLARQLEEAIEEAERQSPGCVPGELKAAVNLRLRPQPDPYDALRASVARAVASPVGAPDFTLRRFSRRQQADMPRLRGVTKLTPNVVVILDTSGSMGFGSAGYHSAERAMDVIAKGIRKLKSVRIICWDTEKHSAKMLQSMAGFTVEGGGGTDMGQAIETIDKELRPDAILMVTDCLTGWCKRKPRARVVIAATEAPMDSYPTPHWATVVDLTKGGGR